MSIPPVNFNSVDPLRLLSHEVVFSRGKEREQEEEDEEKEEDERYIKIWKSLFPHFEKKRESPPIVLRRNILHELSQKLNSSSLQEQIYLKLLLSDLGPKESKEEAINLIKNLEKLNEKIDKANNVWFRKIPLVSRIFSVIDKIEIPFKLNL